MPGSHVVEQRRLKVAWLTQVKNETSLLLSRFVESARQACPMGHLVRMIEEDRNLTTPSLRLAEVANFLERFSFRMGFVPRDVFEWCAPPSPPYPHPPPSVDKGCGRGRGCGSIGSLMLWLISKMWALNFSGPSGAPSSMRGR